MCIMLILSLCHGRFCMPTEIKIVPPLELRKRIHTEKIRKVPVHKHLTEVMYVFANV